MLEILSAGGLCCPFDVGGLGSGQFGCRVGAVPDDGQHCAADDLAGDVDGRTLRAGTHPFRHASRRHFAVARCVGVCRAESRDRGVRGRGVLGLDVRSGHDHLEHQIGIDGAVGSSKIMADIPIFLGMIGVGVRAGRRVGHHAALQALFSVSVLLHAAMVGMVAVSALGMVVARLRTGMGHRLAQEMRLWLLSLAREDRFKACRAIVTFTPDPSYFGGSLAEVDPEVAAALDGETARQAGGIELIASENLVSRATLDALASPIVNKTVEGYPGARYYGGAAFADQIERLAIERAKELFGAAYANVQPHSGSQANLAVFVAFLKPGATVLSMDLSAGGHLSHGASPNISGVVTTTTYKNLRGVRGGLVLSHREDLARKLNSAVFPGVQGSVILNAVAAKAVCLGEALRPEFKAYGRAVLDNARSLAAALAERGVAVLTGGTDTPIVVADLRPSGLTGAAASDALEAAGLTANKNSVPGDPQPPQTTSGLRFGTSAAPTGPSPAPRWPHSSTEPAT